MEIVEIPTTGWKKLDWIIAQFVKMINQRTMIKGNGILLTEQPTGVIISIDPKADTTRAQTPGGGQTSLQPGAYALTWNGVGWKDLTVVDPATCAQSNIKVLVQDGSLSLTVSFDPAQGTITITNQ